MQLITDGLLQALTQLVKLLQSLISRLKGSKTEPLKNLSVLNQNSRQLGGGIGLSQKQKEDLEHYRVVTDSQSALMEMISSMVQAEGDLVIECRIFQDTENPAVAPVEFDIDLTPQQQVSYRYVAMRGFEDQVNVVKALKQNV